MSDLREWEWEWEWCEWGLRCLEWGREWLKNEDGGVGCEVARAWNGRHSVCMCVCERERGLELCEIWLLLN